MPQDKYYSTPIGVSDPSNEFYAVVPSDSDDLPQGPPKALYIGTGGDLAVLGPDNEDPDQSVLFANVQSGSTLPIRPSRVLDDGTTAADIVALY